jgi:cholest-4-en-3-one 26-monooxygenase
LASFLGGCGQSAGVATELDHDPVGVHYIDALAPLVVKLHQRFFAHRRQSSFRFELPRLGRLERHMVHPHRQADSGRYIGLPIGFLSNAVEVEERNAAPIAGIEEHVAQEVLLGPNDLSGDFGVDEWETESLIELGGFSDISACVRYVVKTWHSCRFTQLLGNSQCSLCGLKGCSRSFRSVSATETASGPVVDPTQPIDLLDPHLWQRNPHELWTHLRAEQPVYHERRNGLFAMTRHADVLMVERRADIFPSAHSYRAIPAREEMNMIAQDDPGHRAQRMLVQRFFAPGPVARREPAIRAIVTELIDAALAQGQMEVIHDLAGQLPARLTTQLMGFPEELWPKLKEWSERLMRTDMHQRDGQIAIEFMYANMELFEATKSAVDARKGVADAPDDLLSVWANAEINGEPLDIRSIYHESGLFVSGGSETTRTTIAHGLAAFAEFPEQWARLRSDPSLIPSAIEEIFRWVTPLNNFFRVCVKPTEVSGTLVGAGDRVILVYPSANRDEAVFQDPFKFDIGRTPNHHISFGNGPHMCVGAPLARVTMKILLEELARRVKSFEVLSAPEVEANIFARAVKRFDLAVVPA